MVEAQAAIPASAARYEAGIHEFVELLRQAAPARERLSGTIEETLIGGVAWIANQQIRRGRGAQARELLPDLAVFLLSPYHRVGGINLELGWRK